jgi:excisionase family DNA binding protein
MAKVNVFDVPTSQIQTLESARDALPEGALRDALDAISVELRKGDSIVVLGKEATLTPSEAAGLLGLSRTHLYKILDSGVLRHHLVGERDRRVLASDLLAYRDLMFDAQRNTALALASGSADDDRVLDEMS